MGKAETTKLAMVRAAERLFAERGVDVVSLREIAGAAGQGNHSAVLYHFGDKRTLLEAVLSRHSAAIDASLVPALEQLGPEGSTSLHDVVRVFVAPLVRKLDDEDGGPSYLLICSELVNSKTFPITSLKSTNGPGAVEIMRRMFAYAGTQSPLLVPLHMLRTASVLFGSLAAYHRLTSAGMYLSREEFTEDLIEAIVALNIAARKSARP